MAESKEKTAEKKETAAKKTTAAKSTAAKKATTSKAKSTTTKAKAAPKKETAKKEAPVAEKAAAKEEVAVAEAPVAEAKAEKVVKSAAERLKELEQFRKDFDWDSIGKFDEKYAKDEHDKLEKMYNDTLTSIEEQDVIDGVVVSITPREVVVNIGYKSDGVITKSELRYKEDLKIGDTVEVFIESQEDKNGQLVLSHKKARALRAWERVNEALKTQ